jgi:hypothetical protein
VPREWTFLRRASHPGFVAKQALRRQEPTNPHVAFDDELRALEFDSHWFLNLRGRALES